MFKLLFTTALIFGMAAIPPPAAAQSLCMPRAALTEQLHRQYGESLLVEGVIDPQHMIEFWVAPAGQSWTLLLSRADGLVCVMAAGMGWLPAPPVPKPVAESDAS